MLPALIWSILSTIKLVTVTILIASGRAVFEHIPEYQRNEFQRQHLNFLTINLIIFAVMCAVSTGKPTNESNSIKFGIKINIFSYHYFQLFAYTFGVFSIHCTNCSRILQTTDMVFNQFNSYIFIINEEYLCWQICDLFRDFHK